jgi:uncharacterized protein
MSESGMYRTGYRGALALANRIAKSRDKDEGLRFAVDQGDLALAERMLREGANINAAKGAYQTTVLMEAAVRGNVGIMSLLLEKGADVNARDKDGWSALMGATVQGHLQAVNLLLEHDADVNAKNHGGETALVMAVGSKNTAIKDALVAHGAVNE